jgi:hypothetical protein
VNEKLERNRHGFDGSGGGLILRYYPGIHLEKPRKTTKNISHDSRAEI